MTHNIIIIGDTHFGIKNNSMTWLKHQRDGFREIIQYIKSSMQKDDTVTVIHVGDLFDSRSAINPLIYREVTNLLHELDDILGTHTDAQGRLHVGRMYIIGGNHDYYYPWESPNNFTGIEMIPQLTNIHPIVNGYLHADDMVLIPWYDFHNPVKLEKALRDSGEHDMVFTHTDPYHMTKETMNLIKGHTLITGHIHQPTNGFTSIMGIENVLVTGSAFPTDFTDRNSHRGFWTLKMVQDQPNKLQGNFLNFHPVFSSIHFHTINEDMLEDWKEFGIREDDYVEILIKQSHTDQHKATIKTLMDLFNTVITPVPDEDNPVFESTEVLNVDTVCKRMLPDKLKGIYQQMVDACKKKEQ